MISVMRSVPDHYDEASELLGNGKGSTDVAEIWIHGIDFDRVEYVFEP